MEVFKNILNFIFPAKCYVCQATIGNKGLCVTCYEKLQIKQHTCCICGVDIPNFSNTCALCLHKDRPFNSLSFYYTYNDVIYSLISQFKYFHQLTVQQFLVQSLIKGSKQENLKNIDAVIPVPMHYSKLLQRRYNHSAILAKDFAKQHNLYFNPFILKKHKRTKAQMTLVEPIG